jgi:RNA polymerase subunit RPABC4/transcription elongation factor Spt4
MSSSAMPAKKRIKTLTIAQHENAKIVCPDCGSDNVEQHWSAFYLITSRKAA